MSKTAVSISHAAHSDLPEMVAITCSATETDVLIRFLYGHRPAEANRKHAESLLGSLGKRFTEPTNRCHILKATDQQTGEIVGWILVRWEDGSWVYGKSDPPDQSESHRSNFPRHFQREYRKNWLRITEGKPHVVIGAIYVQPDRQGQGVGRQLMEHIYSSYDLDSELVIAQTRAVSEGFYQKLGWVTADSTDLDLSEWGGKGNGFGLQRSPQMVRYPKNKGAAVATE